MWVQIRSVGRSSDEAAATANANVTANATVTVGDAGDADASTYTVTGDTIAGTTRRGRLWS